MPKRPAPIPPLTLSEGVWEKNNGERDSGRSEAGLPTEAHRRRTQWYAEDAPTEARPT